MVSPAFSGLIESRCPEEKRTADYADYADEEQTTRIPFVV
jgi:hypothetical protein